MTRARDLANIADGTFTATDLDLSGTLTVSGDATFDTNTLFVDVSTDRVGVGTTSPGQKLHITGNVYVGSGNYFTASTSGYFFGGSGSFTNGIYGIGVNNVAINANGSERMRITSGGNVGIGTSSPVANLEIEDGGTSNGVLLKVTADDSSPYGVIVGNDSFSTTDIDGLALYTRNTGEAVIRANGTGSKLEFNVQGTQAAFIDSSGNVGIGTTSPLAKLHVDAGSGNLTGYFESSDSEAYIVIKDNATSGDYTNKIGAIGDNLFFETNNSERMRIDSSGNVLVGATSSITTIGGSLQVSGSQTITSSRTTANAFGSDVNFAKSRGGTSIVSSGDNLGNLIWWGANGTGYNTAAAIKAEVDGTPGASNDMPGRLVFSTTADGSASPTERMRIDSSGNVGIGTTSPSYKLHVSGTGYVSSYLTAGGISADTSSALLFRDGGGSEAMRIDSSGNLLVGKTSIGSNVVGFQVAADGKIAATVSDDETAILNRTTSDGDIVQFRKDGSTVGSIGTKNGFLYIETGDAGLTFDNTNNRIFPSNNGTASDNILDLGHSSARFVNIYATNATIQTSDANEKQDIEELSEAERRVAVACKGLLRKFRWISSVEEKGDDARIHFGIIAQDLQAAFEAEGLDAGRYAMFIHSTWTDEETGEERSRMGVRYSELLAFIIAAL